MRVSEFLESTEEFQVAFGGEKSIDALLFANVINDTVELVKASANVIDPSCFIRLEIKANKEGSFKTIIDVVTRYSSNLLTYTSIAGNIIQGFINFLLIKKHLKGEKAKKLESENNEMVIQNQNNDVLKVPDNIGKAFFKNNKIDNLIINATSNVYIGERDYLSLKSKDKEIVIDKSEYENMKVPVVDDIPIVNKIVNKPIEVNLLLKKPDLLGDSKWEFIYNKKIEAKIDDKDFLQKVKKGKIRNLYAGVRILCKLQFEYELDINHDIVPNSEKYTILEVIGDIIEPQENNQSNLF